MKSEKRKLNFIAFCGIISLISLLTFIGYIIFYAASVFKGFSNFDFIKFFNNDKLAIIIIAVVYFVFDLALALSIWLIKWETDWCLDNKFIYGLLSLFIPFIIPFAYVIIAKKKIYLINLGMTYYINNKRVFKETNETIKHPYNYVVA